MRRKIITQMKILVAEDDANIRMGLVDTLESEGYQVIHSADGNRAMTVFKAHSFDLVLLDIMTPEKSGYDVFSRPQRGGLKPGQSLERGVGD